MDFDSLPRRDLQFFCKKNKIPANMTNIAMADALKALEIVEGIDDYMNQSESTRDLSPTSIARNMPSAARTAARTTRRKATKEETQSSELVTRSCLVMSKSLSEEMEQENKNTNMLQNPPVPQSRRRAAATSVSMKLDDSDYNPEANVSKTPAARSTRTQAAASCKKDESVQRVYSTRRSVRLLEESMADLSLKTKDSLIVPEKKNEDAKKEDSVAGSKLQTISDENFEENKEAEVVSVRDLNDSMEKEWDTSKNDPDVDVLYGDLGDTTFSDNTSEEQMKEIEFNSVTASESFVLVKEQETLQEDDFVVVDIADSTVTVACNKESKSEEMMIGSETESEETEFETDPEDETFESKVSASYNVSNVDSVTTVLIAGESEESKPKEEEICESGELIDSKSEAAPVSDNDGWSDFDESEIKLDENICGLEESGGTKSDMKKTPGSTSLSAPLGMETKTQLSQFEAESITESDKEKVEMVVNNNEEKKTEATAKKKTKKKLDEESLKDVSNRQLLKMLKDLTITNKQVR